ncbi:hypothetical protein TL16_g12743 [Triparma laevis f. inornata]|uniref:FZ domain-containing protein n=1 Tax=Triparma laevis f. inornata TaxID=1714386 RepID=A0A9W7BNG3_9STRA|nr:hypothetical protein TL16_g12743 [Triparma laevis f. inornata]
MPQISPPLVLLLLFSTLNPSVQYQANPISPSLPFLSRPPAEGSSLRSRNLKQCPKECDAIPVQSDLPYCGSVIGYSVCQTQDTWIGQDALFPSFIDKLGINLDDLSAAADGSNEDRFTYDCANAIIQLECKNLFPACEIGVEVRPLCERACEQTIELCQDTEFALKMDTCEELGLSDSPTCVDLGYEGANHMLWIAGFSIGLTFSFLAALGLNLQKLSMNKENKKPKSLRRPTPKQPMWLVGMFLITSGSLLDFVAFGMAPQSLLAPLGALSLVWNAMIAPLFNGEKLTRQNLIATGIIMFGTLMTVIFAAHSTPTYTLEDLMSLYQQPAMIVYMVFVVAFLVGTATKLKKIEKEIEESGVEREEDELPLTLGQSSDEEIGIDSLRDRLPSTPSKDPRNKSGSGSKFFGGSVRNNLATPSRSTPAPQMHRIICYGGLAGCFGGMSVLLAKSTAELVKNVLSGTENNAFTHFQPYLIVISMVTCLFAQINILNSGLSKFNALLMVPVYQSFWNLFSVFGGIIYFQEYRDLHMLESTCFIMGLCITLSGVVCLLKERTKEVNGGEEKGSGKYSKVQSFDNSFENSFDNPQSFDGDMEDGEEGEDSLEDELRVKRVINGTIELNDMLAE